MWWELSGDAPEQTGRNLVRTAKESIGGLEWRENELRYPGSSEFLFNHPQYVSITARWGGHELRI